MKKKLLLLLCTVLLYGCEDQTDPVAQIWDDVPEISILDRNLDLHAYDGLDTTLISWGIGKERDENNQPLDCIKANERYQAYQAIFVKEPDHQIYLTFDCGYENGNTAKILDILKAKQAPATFFVTTQYVLENPELVRRMIDEGHTVGNHSYHHKSFPTVPLQEVLEEVADLDDLLVENFQYKMTLVRPPKGEFNEQTLALCHDLGYTDVFWTVAYYDYDTDHQPDPSMALKTLLDRVCPGAVLLLHSVSDTNTLILGDLVDRLREYHYKIGDLSTNRN